MLQKNSLSRPYQRVANALRDMRQKARPGQKDASLRGSAPDYVIEAALEDGVAVYRIFKPTNSREELARRMHELAELMRRKNYCGAIIDVRGCRFDTRAAANDLSSEAALPYAVNPLWRLALLVPAEDDGASGAMLDALLKLHHRAGVQMLRFEEYEPAVQWLHKAREGMGTRL